MKKAYGIFALLAIGLIATGGLVNAWGNEAPILDEERHAAMEEAFDNLDYEAWINLMDGKGRVTEVITEENFETFAKIHEARENDDLETANALRAELGLGQKNGQGRENGGRNMDQGMHKGTRPQSSKQGRMQGPRDGTGMRQEGCPFN